MLAAWLHLFYKSQSLQERAQLDVELNILNIFILILSDYVSVFVLTSLKS